MTLVTNRDESTWLLWAGSVWAGSVVDTVEACLTHPKSPGGLRWLRSTPFLPNRPGDPPASRRNNKDGSEGVFIGSNMEYAVVFPKDVTLHFKKWYDVNVNWRLFVLICSGVMAQPPSEVVLYSIHWRPSQANPQCKRVTYWIYIQCFYPQTGFRRAWHIPFVFGTCSLTMSDSTSGWKQRSLERVARQKGPDQHL